MTTISKILFQTNHSHTEYVAEMIKDMLSPEWKYEFYSDADVIQFFINNPLTDFPDIVQKYNSFVKGAHKADLFRYYYLYINGGFFLDYDAMLYVNIDIIVKNYDFVSVNSSYVPGTIFQGVLGASPQNKIIKKALELAYTSNQYMLHNDYHHFCRQLYTILEDDTFGYNTKLYKEQKQHRDYASILDDTVLLIRHYYKTKVIPPVNKAKVIPHVNKLSHMPRIKPTTWNKYKRSQLNMFDYRVLTVYEIPNNMIRVGPHEDGGYIIVDGFSYDLFISCGIGNDVRFEDAFLDIHNIRCIAFDGTISLLPPHRNNIEWIPKNIGYSNDTKTTNLKEYIQDSRNIFFKMDIEGSEFNWLDSMLETELENISQLVIEFHFPFDVYRMNILNKLNNTHYIVHIHGNNNSGIVEINNKILPQIKLPEVFEITYINKKIYDKHAVKIKETHYPTMLDFPNNPKKPDVTFSIPVSHV